MGGFNCLCPVYLLDARLQKTKHTGKMEFFYLLNLWLKNQGSKGESVNKILQRLTGFKKE